MSKPIKKSFDYISFLREISNNKNSKSNNNKISNINIVKKNKPNKNTDNQLKELFPYLSKCRTSRDYNLNEKDIEKIKNLKIKLALNKSIKNNSVNIDRSDQIKKENDINKTFYSIKRKMNVIFPHSYSSININKNNYKNVFCSDSFETINNKKNDNDINNEYNNKRKKYELLLYSLIKKDKNPKENELNIKYKFINKVKETVQKDNDIKLKLTNNEILKRFKISNYIDFKKDITHSLKRKKEMENKIRIVLNSAESKFDNIFLNIMGKKYNLSSKKGKKKN